jgi:hypothetical protein
MASCVGLAVFVGLPMALAFDFARASLAAVERSATHSLKRTPGSALADGAVFAYVGAPAAQAYLVGTAALALAVAPFIN